MKSFPVRRLLASVLLLGVAGAVVAVWLYGTEYGRRRIAQEVRQGLTANSELVLGPFEVDFSPWRDFPHLTASLHRISLTDTSHQRRVPVLRLQRADMRLELASLLRGNIQVTRLVITDVDFRERVDSLGRSWGLRGKRRKGTGAAPTLNLNLQSLVVNNFRFSSRNEYSRSAFGVRVRQAQLTARLQRGVLRVAGSLNGQLSYLRTRAGTLFEREPVQAWVHYKYTFENRQGLLYQTRATLNGDTIRVTGTHTVDPNQPVGTRLQLKFIGNQPLTEVLHAALPPRLEPYLVGATSPSKAHIHYTITGLSGPTVTPRNVLMFRLRNASLRWPEPARRINRWDLQGTYDNGPAHNLKSTVLTLQRCRIYSPVGKLDVALTLQDFKHPYVNGHFRGRTELPGLAAVLAPGHVRARAGIADLDVRVRGLLPAPADRPYPGPPQNGLSLRGTVALRGAAFGLPRREAELTQLNVQIGLRDSLLRLSNAAGVLNGMRFRAAATTTYLYEYLYDEHPTASIRGTFSVDELRLDRLRSLLRPLPRTAGPGFSPGSVPKPARGPRDRAQLAATLGSELIPPGLLLNVALRCQRLLLATDTLTDLAVTVRHDGQRVQLRNLAGRVWGGRVQGQVEWPTDPDNRVAPVQYQLGIRFATLHYEQFVARLRKPEAPTTPTKGSSKVKGKGAAMPALRDLLLTANGRLSIDIGHVQLPDNQSLKDIRMRLEKTGELLQMPFLRFRTPEGGRGEATATVQVDDLRFVAADADVTLRYATLDVPRLLALVTSLTTPASAAPTARTRARAVRRATRQEAQQNTSVVANGVLSAVLRVEADEVRYAAIRGTKFRLVSRLLEGEAQLDNCTFDAFEGRISLRGQMLSTADRAHHPAQAQVQLEGLQLSPLFATANAMGLNVLGGDNIRGSLRGVVDLRTDLGPTFLPDLQTTVGYLKTDFRDLELLNVEVLMEALKFIRTERSSHLVFEPVSSQFVLADGQLLIPGLRLNSNISSLEVSGRYGLNGRSNLYVGLKPLQALFGNNDKRVERIQEGEPKRNANRKLTYINLRRDAPGDKYKVRFFQKGEQRQAQDILRQQYRALLRTERLDTTMRLVR